MDVGVAVVLPPRGDSEAKAAEAEAPTVSLDAVKEELGL